MSRPEGSKNIKRTSLEIYVDDHPHLRTDGGTTECLICHSFIKTGGRDGKGRISSHEGSQYHIDNFKELLLRGSKANRQINTDEIHKRITQYFVSTGIPLTNLDSQEAISFFKDCFGFNLRCSETYRCNYLEKIVAEVKEKVYKAFYNTNFVIKLDETHDANGRYILNIFGQALNGVDSRHYLLDTLELEKCNSANILQALKFLIPNLIKDFNKLDHFKGLVTDGAQYCLLLGKLLKVEFPGIRHIICICHNLHLVADEIRKNNSILNEFISEIKSVLVKNKTNRMIYFEETNLPMIKLPIVTRWGTWLRCANFIFLNLQKIERFIQNLPEKYTEIKGILENPKFKDELKNGSDSIFICEAITYLESEGLTLDEQLRTLFSVRDKLYDDDLKKRFDKIISNNVDLKDFIFMNDNFSLECELYKFLNLTTVHVERSFSVLKNVQTEKRRSIKPENLYNYTSLQINKKF